MARPVKEWIGATQDSKVPPRVRIRIFEREGGKCHLSGRKIAPGELWDLDHKVALVNGGLHSESNLFPALRDKHKEKTREDVAEKSEIAAIKGKHLGAVKPAGKIKSAGFPDRPKREPKHSLPPRAMYK